MHSCPRQLSMYRRGDFLIAYGRDAETLAELLDLEVMVERHGRRRPLKMAGFPGTSLGANQSRLADAGYRVVVVD